MKKYYLLTTIFSLSLAPQAFASAMAPATLAATAHNTYHGAASDLAAGISASDNSVGLIFLAVLAAVILVMLAGFAYLVHRDNSW